VNNKGGPGKNVAIDLDLEHDNNDLTQPIKNLGPNVTVDAVRRISNGQQKSKQMLSSMDREILVKQWSGKHISADYSKDNNNVIFQEKLRLGKIRSGSKVKSHLGSDFSESTPLPEYHVVVTLKISELFSIH